MKPFPIEGLYKTHLPLGSSPPFFFHSADFPCAQDKRNFLFLLLLCLVICLYFHPGRSQHRAPITGVPSLEWKTSVKWVTLVICSLSPRGWWHLFTTFGFPFLVITSLYPMKIKREYLFSVFIRIWPTV